MSSTHSSNWPTNLWRWSVKHSPLLNLTRWILGLRQPKARVFDLLDNVDLPQELTRLIETTVRKTKLWKFERIEIAQELITHTQDALEAGRSPDQITESFGNPKKVAKLLKRAAKRKRPLHWRSLQRARQGVAMVIALFCVVYAVQFVRYIAGQPSINTNYVAQINAHNEAYSEDEKAWPIYNQAKIAWEAALQPIKDEQRAFIEKYNINKDGDLLINTGLREIPHITQEHPLYEQTTQLIRDFAPHLEQVREAAHRPIIGINLSFDLEITEEGDNPYDTRMAPPPEDPEDQPILVELLLPNLGTTRQHANLLYFDMLVAARDGDSPRVYENISALLAMCRQKSFDGTLIADLVRIAIASLANEGIKTIISEHPDTLTREQLVNLSHELALVRPTLNLSFDGERMMFDDVLQRTYTDDGNGNGRLTNHGSQILLGFHNDWSDYTDIAPNPVQILTGPIALTLAPDRKTQHEIYHDMMDLVQSVQEKGPQSFPHLTFYERLTEKESNRRTDVIGGLIVAPADLLLPPLSSAVNSVFQAQLKHTATQTILALEIYKHSTGAYPEHLDLLSPNYLPEHPVDAFNPGVPLRYLPTDSGYILYSVGSDGDDDHAQEPEHASEFKGRNFPRFSDRFPGKYDSNHHLILDDSGKPVPGTPAGPDGDWVFINMNNQSTLDPKTKEPDQSPAPESIN